MVDGSWHRIFLLRPSTKKERSVDDLLEHGDCCRRRIPSKYYCYSWTVHTNQCHSGSSGDSLLRSVTLRVNLSGIYVSIRLRCQSGNLHMSSRLFWAEGSSRETLYRKCTSAIDSLLCLPADVRFAHVCTSLPVYYIFCKFNSRNTFVVL